MKGASPRYVPTYALRRLNGREVFVETQLTWVDGDR